MDQREHMALSGPGSYYMHRGSTEPVAVFQDSTIMNPLSNANLHFPSYTGSSLIGSTLPLDTSSAISPHRVSVRPPSTVLQAEPVRRKRGRPRKYGRDGSVPSALFPSTSNPMLTVSGTERRRGRPPGPSRKLKSASLGASLLNFGGTLTPHVIHVVKGEDIKRKILSFFGGGQRAIVILSGIGAISTINCRTSGSGGTITYEGCFDMLNLSGSYMHNDTDGLSGSLNVTVAGPDGNVIGGGVEGVLIAASPVQIIVGSVLPRPSKNKAKVDDGLKPSMDAPTNVHPTQNLSPVAGWPGL
ncbi:DNA binding protein [Dorcoceras hygrometricum]|uniref:AT-hook motif nuclear-localized protein n=1 Tax=Dorcoceras hygrometricum TaxID=472368 RepID=A0A2Z7BXY6_9LAMI|nr:DNA binding protein [Dorcoceras hygrometricum]